MLIRIKDNREPLVDIRKYCPNAIIKLDPRRLRFEKTVYLRKTVAQMLGKAASYLPKGIRFVIGDAWRPAFVQTSIFHDFIRKGKKRYPGVPEHTLIAEIKKYVAPWKGISASGHMSGGAIDLRLVDRRGRKIPMNSQKLDYRENAFSAQPKLPEYLQRNRRILFSVMHRAGFSNYPREYWHWSYGDYQWAKRNEKSVALYSVVADIQDIYIRRKCPCGSGKKYKKCHGK